MTRRIPLCSRVGRFPFAPWADPTPLSLSRDRHPSISPRNPARVGRLGCAGFPGLIGPAQVGPVNEALHPVSPESLYLVRGMGGAWPCAQLVNATRFTV